MWGPIACVKPFGAHTQDSMTGTAGTIDGGTRNRFALDRVMFTDGLAALFALYVCLYELYHVFPFCTCISEIHIQPRLTGLFACHPFRCTLPWCRRTTVGSLEPVAAAARRGAWFSSRLAQRVVRVVLQFYPCTAYVVM